MSALIWDRIQFAFTITYHYLFPQLTMGLALLILVLEVLAVRRDDSRTREVARFWARIFAINFGVGVVTGIPMEFQFGTNWARFADYSGGVIGLTLAMEGMFAFFAESAFLGLYLFGEKRLGRRGHLFAAFMLFLGAWASGYFIVTTNAFMQHPVGYQLGAKGKLELLSLATYLANPWAIWAYLHTMTAAVETGAFVMAALGAYWLLMGLYPEHARISLRTGVVAGLVASIVLLFPTGDQLGKLVARHQPVSLAAMEGKFKTSTHAELALIGQPDVARRELENPLIVPEVLSFLAYGSFGSEVKGLEAFPTDDWPDNVPLVYFAYHIMVGLGTLLMLTAVLAAVLLWKRRLYTTRAMLWVLMLAFPFPYIATTSGWVTAEVGRQPWLIYGVMRTLEGPSPAVGSGDVVFTTLGFCGLYLVLGLLFLYLVGKTIARGPLPRAGAPATGYA